MQRLAFSFLLLLLVPLGAFSQKAVNPLAAPTPPPGGAVAPQVGLDTYSIKPEQGFGFAGSGFQPGEWVNVYLGTLDDIPSAGHGSLLTRAYTNAGGNLAGYAVVPMLPAGDYPLSFVGWQNRDRVVKSLNIQKLNPWVVLDNYSPPPHALLGFRGQGFAAGEPVVVYLNQQGQAPILRLAADKDGQFTAERAWQLPDLSGTNTLIFVGGYTEAVVAVSFVVLSPQPSPAPAQHMAAKYATNLLPTGVPPARLLAQAGSNTRQNPARTSGLHGAAVPGEADVTAGSAAFLALDDPITIGLLFLAAWLLLCVVLVLLLVIPHPEKNGHRKRMRGDMALVSWGKRTFLKMQAAAKSDRGRSRAEKENEDGFLVVQGTHKAGGELKPFGLFVVVDGMGEHAIGQKASRMALEVIFRSLVPSLIHDDVTSEDVRALLEEAIQHANQILYRLNQQEHANMGSTVTAALVTGYEASICNVGDSRTYLMSPQSSLRRITIDHSIVESLVVAEVIRRDDVYTHPRRGQIYRILGQKEWVQIDTFQHQLAACDQLLLCSDGLWEMVRDPELESIMRMCQGAYQASAHLIERANEKGGLDNITALVVKMGETPHFAKEPGIEYIDCSSVEALGQRSYRSLLRGR